MLKQLSFPPCCCCGGAEAVRNIILLNKLAPVSGQGWGCILCGLPCNGAVAVICNQCLESISEIKYVCAGSATDPRRVPVSELPAGEFNHNPACHPQHLGWPQKLTKQVERN